MSEPAAIALVGGGYTARAIAAAAPGRVRFLRRRPCPEEALLGPVTVVTEAQFPPLDAPLGVVTFPPTDDGAAERAVVAASAGASLVYLSTVGVYGDAPVVDEGTAPAASADPRRRAAEEIFLAAGGLVLRCPGIYGPGRGLHVRIAAGLHRIPGDGERFGSRIHVADLARLVLALGPQRLGPLALPVADAEPATHGAVARYVAGLLGLPAPPCAPLAEVPATLRGDRQVRAGRAWSLAGLTPEFPSYREGFAAAIAAAP